MSRTIDAALKAKLLLMQQTVYNNANLYADVKVLRPKTPLSYKQYLLEAEVAPVSSTCTSTAIRRRSLVRPPDYAYVAYVSDSVLYVKRARLTYPLTSMIWEVIETINAVTQCSLTFDGHFANLVSKQINFLTDEVPWLFYVGSDGSLNCGILGGVYEILVASNVTSIDSIRGVASKYKDMDQGILCFYIVAGNVYYNSFVAGAWEGQEQVTLAPANALSVKAERTFDWRIVLQVMDNTGALYEIFSRMYASGWNGTEYIDLVNIEASSALLPVYYWDYAEDEYIELSDMAGEAWNYAIYAPTLLSARNLSTQIEDPENPGEYITSWGYIVEFKFDQIIPNAAAYPADFKITDAYNFTWYGQSAIVSGQYVIVTFNDFNNAGNPVTAVALAGNLSNGYMLLTETSIQFNATGLVPTYVPPPVPQSITNLSDWEVTQ